MARYLFLHIQQKKVHTFMPIAKRGKRKLKEGRKNNDRKK